MDGTPNKFQDFTTLEVWKQARLLQNDIFQLVRSFPSDEKFRLVDQMVRSSRSIGANIAEGHGRFHYQEQIRYCITARGSLSETLNHLIVAFDCKYIGEDVLTEYREKYNHVLKLINGYSAYLKKLKASAGDTNVKD